MNSSGGCYVRCSVHFQKCPICNAKEYIDEELLYITNQLMICAGIKTKAARSFNGAV